MLAAFSNLLRRTYTYRFLDGKSDLMIVMLVIGIIGIIILPLPPWGIDILIAINLTFAIALILTAIYIDGAVQLSTFPSLLLLTTLFRLSINIASTRQILLKADAGHIIETFGNLVTGGNIVVGIVIFSIITLVNFMVITKGAERVAEVAARFTLDAMPGKQMSIDADLRAGMMDNDQARDARAALGKESQLYGAMDGAMKFVKGDAIAGIIMTIINLVGGLIVGMMQMGMTAGAALQRFGVLSIGDGLVSMVPALLISISAGILITRVSNDRKKSNLGAEIIDQFSAQPKALMLVSGVLIAAAMVPGFPKVTMIGIAVVLAGIVYPLYARTKDGSARRKRPDSAKTVEPARIMQTDIPNHSVIPAEEGGEYNMTLPIILEAGEALTEMIVNDSNSVRFVENMIPRMRMALYHDLGVRFPGVHIRTDSPRQDKQGYALLLNEVPIIQGKFVAGHVLTNESEAVLNRYNIPFTSYKNALNLPSLWVPEKHMDLLAKAGIRFWKPLEVVTLHLSYFLRYYAGEFMGIQEVKTIVSATEKTFPDLVKEVTRLVPLQKLTEIFKRLVQEQISIKDLRSIMEALAEWAQSEKDVVLLTEYVRTALKRYISFKHSQGQTVLSVYLLDPDIEDMIRGAIKQTSAGSYLALDPDDIQLILQGMRATIVPTPPTGQPPVMLTALDVRRFTRKLIEAEFPDVAVVSYQEIIPEIRIQPLGRVQLP